MNRIPKLRFPEFSKEWKKEKLGKYVEISSGNSPTGLSNETGKIPYFKVEQLNNSIKYQIKTPYKVDDLGQTIPKGSIIFPKRGFSILLNKIRILAQDSYINTNLMILTPNYSKLDNEFLYYFIMKEDLSKIADTTSIPQINNKHIKPYIINFPFLSEQKEIASFLSAIDSKIEKLWRKKELWKHYKKGMVQRIFTGQMRFRNENGEEYPDWGESFISDLFDISTSGNIKTENISKTKTVEFKYPIYTNSDKNKGLFGYSNVYKQAENCVTITGRGNIGVATARYNKFYPIIRLLVLRPKQNQNIKFFEEAINNIEFFVENTGVPQLTGTQISFHTLNYPTLPEQTQIADFLSSLDSKIDIVEKELTRMKEFKKGLLQKMFV